MTIHRGNEKIQEHSVASFVNLVVNKFDITALNGKIQTILMCLTLHQEYIAIQENCMKALAIISSDESKNNQLIKHGIMDVTINALICSLAIIESIGVKFEDISTFNSNSDPDTKSQLIIHQNICKCAYSILFNLSRGDKYKQIIYRKSNPAIQTSLNIFLATLWAPFAIDNQTISLVLGLLRNLSTVNTAEPKNDVTTSPKTDSNDSSNINGTVHISSLNKYVDVIVKIINVHHADNKIIENGVGILRNLSMQSNINSLKGKSVDNVLMNILGKCCLTPSEIDNLTISDLRIEEQCIGAIKNFVPTMKRDRKIELRGRLISILKKSDDVRVLEQVYACLRNLSLTSAESEGVGRGSGSGGRSIDALSSGNDDDGYIPIAPETDSISEESIASWTECANLVTDTMSRYPNDDKMQEQACAALLNMIINQYLGSAIFVANIDNGIDNEDEKRNIPPNENDQVSKLLDKIASGLFHALCLHYLKNSELTEHCLKFFSTYQYLHIGPTATMSYISNDVTIFIDIIDFYGKINSHLAKHACWAIWSILKTATATKNKSKALNLSQDLKERLSSSIKASVEIHKARVNDEETREIEDIDLIQFSELALGILYPSPTPESNSIDQVSDTSETA